MGELIEFPLHRRKVEVEILGPMEECDGIMHVFIEVPGRCQCGENEWTLEDTIEPQSDAIGLHIPTM